MWWLLAVQSGCGRIGFDPACGEICSLPDLGPGGDHCEDATVLTLTQTSPTTFAARALGSTIDAIPNLDDSCGGAGAPDVFYRFDIVTTSIVDVQLRPTEPTYDPILYVRGGVGETCGGLSTRHFCSNAGGPGQEELGATTALEPASYYIVVDGVAGGDADAGSYELVVVENRGPSRVSFYPPSSGWGDAVEVR